MIKQGLVGHCQVYFYNWDCVSESSLNNHNASILEASVSWGRVPWGFAVAPKNTICVGFYRLKMADFKKELKKKL